MNRACRLWPLPWRACANLGFRTLNSASSYSAFSFRASPTFTASSRLPGTVEVSKQRFEELLESEMVHFARAMKPHPMTLQQILHLRDPTELREFLLEELPIRYARRVQLIESLPGWNSFGSMRMIRSLYFDAFRRLRALTQEDKDSFRSELQAIKRRNGNMLFHVVRGARAMRTNTTLADEQVNRFLDEFLTARIGTDILSSQYLAITRPDTPTSVVNPECDPVGVVRSAARDAATLCRHHYGWSPPIDIVDVGQVRFPFISQYLNYIMFELLKNSLRAMVEKFGSRPEAEAYPIRVVICGDDDTVVLRVSDSGGGIPLDDMEQVWSYMYTTARPACEEASNGEMSPNEDDDSDDDGVAPLAGFGCGLPLSRPCYVGGWLELNSIPEFGTDTYLYLNRAGNAQEELRTDLDAALPIRGSLLNGAYYSSASSVSPNL
ncbi:unnamed protein product [Effrenium voratum]|uniref:Protein-serine/threonine kinase n=1 Tax=Effrenium voratum TaxID=2562239 RepID=A0AA36ML39_9DINO|nr:unnamed protein product [Effrenium voratum]